MIYGSVIAHGIILLLPLHADIFHLSVKSTFHYFAFLPVALVY